MTDDKEETKFKCSTFNGDTADGRTQWPNWLRDIELVLDEWSWATMNGEVLEHDEYIGPSCGRRAYAELARTYGRAKEEDTETYCSRLETVPGLVNKSAG